MPEDVRTDDEVEATTEGETPELMHDDIVKRLLDYQRQLREGLDEDTIATTATATATDEIVDLTEVEAEADPDTAVTDALAADAMASEMGGSTIADDEDTTVAAGAAATAADTAIDDAADVADLAPATDDDTSADVIVLHPEATSSSEGAATAMATAASTETSPEEPPAGAWPGIDRPATSATAIDAPRDEAADRIIELERSLETLAARFDGLRSSFQDMAIAADQRLAEIEDLIAQVRRQR